VLFAARAARVLVATARELPTLREAGVELDALVGSARDPDERYRDGDLDPAPKLVVWTEGSGGGRYEPGGGRWEAVPLPGPFQDTYGAGDSFAAGLTLALGLGQTPDQAVRFAASAGAAAMTRRGAHGLR
jgi:ribokinase